MLLGDGMSNYKSINELLNEQNSQQTPVEENTTADTHYMEMETETEMETDTEYEEGEEESSELMKYKKDFYAMSVGSIRAIMHHAEQIINSLDNPMIKENLTASWLQGKIAITEDYVRTIHSYVMFVSDNSDEANTASKDGLWDNIRQKKDREGKKYKPAKKGDKDRPDPKQWKKLTSDIISKNP